MKSNIGHCESAAGIAGLTKVLLQMKHRQLVPACMASAQSRTLILRTAHLLFSSECSVGMAAPVDGGDGCSREMPRLAGISLVRGGRFECAWRDPEEYVRVGRRRSALDVAAAAGPAIIVLSAKNEERLKEQVERLVAAIERRATMAMRISAAMLPTRCRLDARRWRAGLG